MDYSQQDGHFVTIVGIEGDTLKIYDPYLYSGKFETSTRRGKVTVSGNTVYCTIDNFRNYANYSKFFAFEQEGQVPINDTKPITTNSYTRYVNAKIGLNIRQTPNGKIIGGYPYGTAVLVYETNENWSRTDRGWVCSDYLSGNLTSTQSIQKASNYTTGKYKVTASVLNVRSGPGTNYKIKTYKQLTLNARSQNSRLGNYYTNGYKKGVVCTVSKVVGEWGLTPSGYICLKYCIKL